MFNNIIRNKKKHNEIYVRKHYNTKEKGEAVHLKKRHPVVYVVLFALGWAFMYADRNILSPVMGVFGGFLFLFSDGQPFKCKTEDRFSLWMQAM